VSFLTLAQDLRREGSGVGTGPSSVENQVGEYGRIVEWINAAYRAIQRVHATWDFLRFEFTFPTVASTGNYTKATIAATTAGVSELGMWKDDTFRCYLTATGITDQQPLTYVPWDQFRECYTLGSLSTQEGRPMIFTVKADKSVTFWPIPSAIYTITGEYYKRPQSMAADADEPLIPAQYDEAIVWRALMIWGTDEAAPEKYAKGKEEYTRVMAAMELNLLPEMQYGEPML
jgi:hypothetical protein